MTTFTASQLAQLRNEFANVRTASIDCLPRFRSIFAQCSDRAIAQLIEADIRFVSPLAANERIRRQAARQTFAEIIAE